LAECRPTANGRTLLEQETSQQTKQTKTIKPYTRTALTGADARDAHVISALSLCQKLLTGWALGKSLPPPTKKELKTITL